jgi:hypothetical protein
MAWTVNSVARALALRASGVDGVTTDRPAVMTALAAGPGSAAERRPGPSPAPP